MSARLVYCIHMSYNLSRCELKLYLLVIIPNQTKSHHKPRPLMRVDHKKLYCSNYTIKYIRNFIFNTEIGMTFLEISIFLQLLQITEILYGFTVFFFTNYVCMIKLNSPQLNYLDLQIIIYIIY